MIQKNSSLLTRRRRRNKSPNTSSFYHFHLPNLKLPHSDIQGRGFFSRRFPSTTLMHTPLDYIPSEQQSQVTPLHDR